MKAEYLFLNENISLQQQLDIAIERLQHYQSLKDDTKYSNVIKFWRKRVDFYLSIDSGLEICRTN